MASGLSNKLPQELVVFYITVLSPADCYQSCSVGFSTDFKSSATISTFLLYWIPEINKALFMFPKVTFIIHTPFIVRGPTGYTKT